MMKYRLAGILFLVTSVLFSQKITTSVDSTKKKIGSEFKLSLQLEVDTSKKVVFPKNKFIGSLEVIESYPIDTLKKGKSHQLTKVYGLTQFDSGRYLIPKLPILINKSTFYSDSLKIEVQDVKVDTLKQKMYDIKNIIPAENNYGTWWIYLLVFIVLIAIGYFGYSYYKKRKDIPKKEPEVFKSPIEKATSKLMELEKKSLWQKGEVKEYYSELTDIARIYLEEEIHIPAMESTTSELIEALNYAARQKKLKLSKETVANLERVLQHADLVKFAKSQPSEIEIEEDKKRISSAIVIIHESIPEIIEEEPDALELWNEEQKEKARLLKLKKEKRKRIITLIASFVALVVMAFGALIYIKGFDYTKDLIFGNPTKELLEEKWVYSDYGNPSVKIETPKVLKRIDAEKALPKDALATLKEMQLFEYGNISENFYVSVSTVTFKEETKIDLTQAAEGSIKIFESKGAQNILVKTEDFDTQKGISGKKAYGTMTFIDKNNGKSTRLYYEILVFSQNNGLQQVAVFFEEGNNYGKEIMNRIFNSVELKLAP